jgi:hypothetical protein
MMMTICSKFGTRGFGVGVAVFAGEVAGGTSVLEGMNVGNEIADGTGGKEEDVEAGALEQPNKTSNRTDNITLDFVVME